MQAETRAIYRGKLPKPTSRGDVRPEIAGKRFTVGNVNDTTQTQMMIRLNTLRDVFEAQVKMFQIDHWDKWLIPFAQEYGRTGVIVYRVHPSASKIPGLAIEGVTAFEMLKSLGLPVETPDDTTLDTGASRLQRMFDQQITLAIGNAVADIKGLKLAPSLQDRLSVETNGSDHRTLHEALTSYQKHIKKNGKKMDNGQLASSPSNYIKWVNKLKSVHDDVPLIRLDKARLEELIAYWRNREYRYQAKGKETPIGKDYASHIMQSLWSALHWLSDEPSWKWTIPTGSTKIDRSINSLDSDRKKRQTRRIQGTIYSPHQLAMIAERLDRFGKMHLGLSVNCGMQPAESGRVEIGDFFTTHPDTGEKGEFIIFDRPKTHEYGEWILWEEVAELVKWGIERSKRLGCERLLVTDEGKPWYKDHSRQPATKMSKWWQALPTKTNRHIGVVTRMNRDDPNFPRHTIKSLRKILPSWIRPQSKELANLSNARKIDDDGLWRGDISDRYSDRPYDNLAQAIKGLESSFQPFLEALKT
jgi:hypothetical protein